MGAGDTAGKSKHRRPRPRSAEGFRPGGEGRGPSQKIGRGWGNQVGAGAGQPRSEGSRLTTGYLVET